MLKRIFWIRRPVWAWLLLFIWAEMFAVMRMHEWYLETLDRIKATNLLRPAPVPGNDWAASITFFLLWLGIGFGLIHARWYGVFTALLIFLTAYMAWEMV